jgi:hypothetical protein
MNSLLSSSWVGRLSVFAVALLLLGCGPSAPKKMNLNGKISYKGQPLNSGILRIVGANSFTLATIQSGGTFVATDVLPGEVKIGIVPAPSGSGGSSDGKAAHKQHATPASLPAKFQNPETSDLKYTITPDMKELVIDIS